MSPAPAPMKPTLSASRNTYNLGPLTGIPEGKGRTFCVQGHQVAVFRDLRQEVFATQAWCPHLLGPLAEGTLGDGRIACPLHHLQFDLRTGCADGHVCGPIRTYRVAVTARGDILLTVPDPAVC